MNNNLLKQLSLPGFFILATLSMAAPSMAAPELAEHDEHKHENSNSAHEEKGHEEKAHGDHDEDEHDESGHDESGHDESGHDEKGHDGHEEGGHEEDGHGGHGEGGHEEEAAVKLSAEQMAIAGIVSEAITLKNVSELINAPGEVVLNAYHTTSVTPRVSAQVEKRHAKLGDIVVLGQALLTLSSVEMSNAQGKLLVTEREWLRVKELGRKVVSASRYTEARVAHEQAKARVLAYGMTITQVKDFLKTGDASKANGTFQLLARQGGTVIKDDFILGELIDPGRELFVISDESVLWVEAKLTPLQVKHVSPGNAVVINSANQKLVGKVVQVHHALDEDTRTLGVRIAFDNPDDELHPGVFVQTKISSNNTAPAFAVPVNAVLRSPDGDWMVFIEHEPGEFEPQEVELVRTVGDVSVIEGLAAGTKVVTQGAFFVQSELAKSGFEIHNH